MEAYSINRFAGIGDLVEVVHRSGDAAVLYDGDDECLVVMQPSVFERILFDSDLLNCAKRETMHL